MSKPTIKISRIKYFPVAKHWRKLLPVYQSPEAEKIWRLNMRDYMDIRAFDREFKYVHNESRYRTPSDYDSCDWRFSNRRGRKPAFWDYVCHSACHWLVDVNLFVACKVFPQFQWRIITTNGNRIKHTHSTIWNGDCENPMLFDLNFLALDVTAKEAWHIVRNGVFLRPGIPLRPYVFNKGYFKKAVKR